jgi:protein-S-isoprenylcysteine O-methyltransferase Ste14
MSPLEATFTAWGVWTLSWIAAAFWADRAERRPPRREEWLYRVVTLAGTFLLFRSAFPHSRVFFRLWRLDESAQWTLFWVALVGLAFTWWARIHLGRLWSSSVTRKADHRIVDSGPYGIVRHPIYTGILLAAAATAVEEGTARGVTGVLLFALGFWIKARLEEQFLIEQLGAADYDAYRRRIPMLIPFGPRG